LGDDWLLICIGRDIGADGNELEYSSAGSYQQVLEAQAARLGIGSRIRFLGDRADAPALLRMMDLVVQPSREEGFSNAVIEAMAAGLPVVATRVAGNAEALDDGRLGALVPAHDPRALAVAIADLYRSPQRRCELGRAARAHVFASYRLQTCVDAYEQIYRALLDGPAD
jgi:glycosyltransferase involved in cell wall biosynthesis